MLRLGPYELVRAIASGGMAEVYLAKTAGFAGFEKYVALKMINGDLAHDRHFITLLINEAKLAVLLEHPNIAQTFDLGRVGNTYYMTMEYVDGIDVFQLLSAADARALRLPFSACAFIAREIALALDYAHARCDVSGQPLNIVHRDVSPENVMITWEGNVKLVDFGIANAAQSVLPPDTDGISGKKHYLSPEVAAYGNIDGRSDIYCAGIVLYEMVTGRPLFIDDDTNLLIRKAQIGRIVEPRILRDEIPAGLESILLRALAPDPNDRYQRGEEMAHDLTRFLHGFAPGYNATSLAKLAVELCGRPDVDPEPDAETVREGADDTILDDNSVIQDGDQGAHEIALAPDLARFGRYEVREQLGSSVLATVHRATRDDGWVVALKRLSPLVDKAPGFEPRFTAELTRAAGRSHANLVQILEFGRHDQTYFVASELVDGVPLARVLHRRGPAPLAVVVAIVGQVLDALAHAQTPHGGVTPANVLLARNGIVKLADLGITRVLRGMAPPAADKLAYSAPELLGTDVADARADVFAVGVIAWELLVGRRLFDATSHHKLLQQLRALEVAPPSRKVSCDPSIDAIVMDALARRGQRLESPAVMRAALAPFSGKARGADVVNWAFSADNAARAYPRRTRPR